MRAAPVRMTIEWFVPIVKIGFIVEALHHLMVAGRAEPGCVGCSVATDVGERGVIRYVEEWHTENDLQRQFTSDRFKNLVALIESGEDNPFVEFTLPGGTRGLDYVEEVNRRQPL